MLVSYIEKKKSLLRKLKACYGRKRRQEEAKALNQQFKEDPGRVHTTINKIVANDPVNDHPKYRAPAKSELESRVSSMFHSVAEAEGFWRALWEERGTGNKKAEWLKEMDEAILRCVPPLSRESWKTETTEAARVISRKRNWSAPGPDRSRLTNYWWKRTCILHGGVTCSFKSISRSKTGFL